MNFRTTLLAATAVAFSALAASAASVGLTVRSDNSGDVQATETDSGNLDLNFGPVALANNDYTLDTAFDLSMYDSILFDPIINGTGSLTLKTFVSTAPANGIGAASVLFNVRTPLSSGATIDVKWNGGPTYDLSDQQVQLISTAYTDSGEIGSQDLIFSWSGLKNDQQLSANIASTPAAVPVPAGLLLLTTALGGLGVARRRNKKADA